MGGSRDLRKLRQRIAVLEAEIQQMTELSSAQFQYIARIEADLGNHPGLEVPKPPAAHRRLLGVLKRLKRPRNLSSSVSAELSDIDIVAGSGLFDRLTYAGTQEAEASGIDPIDHYLNTGEPDDLPPSSRFDPGFYRRNNPDVKAAAVSPLLHYILQGSSEGRAALPAISGLDFPTAGLRSDRETIAVAIHEASRTGAPILGWNLIRELKRKYNVVALLRKNGPLASAFADAASAAIVLPDDAEWWNASENEALAAKAVEVYAPRYLIANSVETRAFIPAFEQAGVPVVALIHEFSSTIRPRGTLFGLFKYASEIVFPAQIVADAAVADYRVLTARAYKVFPQGPCLHPSTPASARDEREVANHSGEKTPSIRLPTDHSILVLGVGTITPRKGVEFFIGAAADIIRRSPEQNIVFAWVGHCYPFDDAYRNLLQEQIERSGLDGHFHFLGEVEDPSPIYKRADIFFLSSRLDPMPNIAIDAALRGIPIVCFEGASGMVEKIAGIEETRELIVPYLDAAAASDRILALAADPKRRRSVGEALRVMARQNFDMARYVESIDALGRAAARSLAQAERSRDTIQATSAFNAEFYLGAPVSRKEASEALEIYLSASRRAMPRSRPNTGLLLRRPREGFHPLIYAGENPSFVEASGEDPVAHDARNGFPKGRWRHELIRPPSDIPVAGSKLRVAIHAHFHYPELLPEFIERLRQNRSEFDLFLTTTSRAAADQVAAVVSRLQVRRTRIITVPNRGRDIGPMLTGDLKRELRKYDVFGHLHGKRSPHADSQIADRWRTFLLENLVGGRHAMMDRVLEAFSSDDRLGLVFAEDPHLNDWDGNRALAEQLARRMWLAGDLPMHFDFPLGTMFWARPAALRRLFDLELDWTDYPEEPLPIDGTILHAIERLLPFVAVDAGYRYAATYVDGVWR